MMTWLRRTVAFLLLLAAACSNDRKSAVSTVYIDENCVKRRLTQIDGEGITVYTLESDGGLTKVAYFDTWTQARKAYPSETGSSNCPDDLTVTIDDLKRNRPYPVITSDAGSDGGE